MSYLQTPTCRHVVIGPAPFLRCFQRRWARVHDIRFVATTHQSNKILDRYKHKLDRKAKEEGLRDINELKEVYKQKIRSLKKEASVTIPLPNAPFNAPPTPTPLRTTSLPPPALRPLGNTPQRTGVKTLASYLDLEKTRALPLKELEAIWRLRHVNNSQSLCAVVPLELYRTIEATAKTHPHFILPLPKDGQGAEIHFLQWTFPAKHTVSVLFTHLAEYKLRGEFSQPHTVITHHLELADEQQVVLLQGQVMDGRGVSVDEAKLLLMCMQTFYGIRGENDRRRKLLERFGKGDPDFSVEELVKEAEKIG